MISVTDFLCVSFEPIRGNVCIKVGVKFSKISLDKLALLFGKDNTTNVLNF